MAVESLAAVRTAPARTDARQDDLVADCELRDARADFGDHADAFVPEDSADLDLGNVAFKNVQIGPTDRGGDHLHNDVGRTLYDRIGNFFPAILAGTFVDECFHFCFSYVSCDVARCRRETS